MATFLPLGILIFLAASTMAEATTLPPSARQEIDKTNNLFRRAVEVYLRQNGENDFEQCQLQYYDASQTVGITDWRYPSMIQPTRAQLIAILTQAKRYLTRLTERDRRREKNRRRANIPPAVYVQQGTSYTGAGQPLGVLSQCRKRVLPEERPLQSTLPDSTAAR